MSRSPHLEVGYVAHAHGLKGELELHTHDPESSVLTEVKRLWLSPRGEEDAGQELRVVACRSADRGWLTRLKGIDRREAAEALRGKTVFVFREDLPPAEEEEDEFFQGDLIGLSAVDEQGTAVGKVEAVWNHGPTPTLVIRTSSGGEELLPFVDDFVIDVLPDEGRVVIRLPEYVD